MPIAERVPGLAPTIRVVLLLYVALLPFKSLLVVERNGFLVLLGLLSVWCLAHWRLFYVRTPFDLPLLAFVVWVGLTVPLSLFPQYSLKEYGKLLQGVVVFYAVVYFLRDEHYRNALAGIVAAQFLVVSAYGVTQYRLNNPQAVMSDMPAESWLTTFLIILIPFAVAAIFVSSPRWGKGGGIVALIASGICLMLTQSRAGLVAMVTELWVTSWLVRARAAMILAGVVSLCLIVGLTVALSANWGHETTEGSEAQARIPIRTTAGSILHRFDIWAFTLSEIPKHWLVGIGYGKDNFLNVYGQQDETVEAGHAAVKRSGAHNILLYMALHVGIPGMILFMWLYGSIIYTTLRETGTAQGWIDRTILCGMSGGLVGLAVRLQFDHLLVGSLAVLFWALVAMAVLSYPSRHTESSG